MWVTDLWSSSIGLACREVTFRLYWFRYELLKNECYWISSANMCTVIIDRGENGDVRRREWDNSYSTSIHVLLKMRNYKNTYVRVR